MSPLMKAMLAAGVGFFGFHVLKQWQSNPLSAGDMMSASADDVVPVVGYAKPNAGTMPARGVVVSAPASRENVSSGAYKGRINEALLGTLNDAPGDVLFDNTQGPSEKEMNPRGETFNFVTGDWQ